MGVVGVGMLCAVIGIAIGIVIAVGVFGRRAKAAPQHVAPQSTRSDAPVEEEHVDLTRRGSHVSTFDAPKPGGPEWMPPGRDPEARS